MIKMTWEVIFEVGPYQYVTDYVTATDKEEAIAKATATIKKSYRYAMFSSARVV